MKRLAIPLIVAAAAFAASAATAQPSHHGHRAQGVYGLGYGAPVNTGENNASGIIAGGPFPRGDRFDERVEPGLAAQTPTLPPAGFEDE